MRCRNRCVGWRSTRHSNEVHLARRLVSTSTSARDFGCLITICNCCGSTAPAWNNLRRLLNHWRTQQEAGLQARLLVHFAILVLFQVELLPCPRAQYSPNFAAIDGAF